MNDVLEKAMALFAQEVAAFDRDWVKSDMTTVDFFGKRNKIFNRHRERIIEAVKAMEKYDEALKRPDMEDTPHVNKTPKSIHKEDKCIGGEHKTALEEAREALLNSAEDVVLTKNWMLRAQKMAYLELCVKDVKRLKELEEKDGV